MTDQKTDPKDLSSEPLDSSPLDSSPLDSSPPDNSFNIRCPRLGHQINFTYCRSENSGLPCFKTLDCWYTHFDVLTHLKEKLNEEEFESTFVQKGKPKVFSLVDLIDQAKERQTKKDPANKDQAKKDQD